MNSTAKRKYNALIQSISSRPTTSSASTSDRNEIDENSLDDADPSSLMASDLGFLAKKRRIETAAAAAATSTPSKHGSLQSSDRIRTPPSKASTTISNITLRKFTPNGSMTTPAGTAAATTSTGTPSKTTKAQPKYCPSDRDQLIKRLASFQELTEWSPKPDRVNEIEWAKRGWVCQGKERVRCTLCNKELVVKLNKKEGGQEDGKEVPIALLSSDVADALVQRYAELVVGAHADDCLWRRRGCDDSLLRLPLAHPKTALEDLRRRYDELHARTDALPYAVNLRLPESIDLDTVLSHLPADFFTNPPPPPPPPSAAKPGSSTPTRNATPDRPALALALTGWQGLTDPRIGAVASSASCHTCLRRLGLWMFRSKQVDPATGAVLVPAPMDHLDPVREHRFFCPWRSGAAQRNAGARATAEEPKAGWEVLAQVLKNDAFLRSRAEGAGSRAVAAGAHGRSKSSVVPGNRPPSTPGRPGTAGGDDGGLDGGEEEEEEDEATRTAKDKERWARLRRVKSLFNTKGGSIRRRLSRPGSRAASRPSTSGDGAPPDGPVASTGAGAGASG